MSAVITSHRVCFACLFIATILLGGLPLQARLGETEAQCADRYGIPRTDAATKANEKASPLIEGAITRTYEYQGWQLRIAFLELDGPAVRIEYRKLAQPSVSPILTDLEIAAILKGNTPDGMSWVKVTYDNPSSPNHGISKIFEGMIAEGAGGKAWKRTDGAIAQVQPGGVFLRLELPAARQYEEELKKKQEQKTRDSIPQF